MTTMRPTKLPAAPSFILPDIPQRHPDDMTSFKYLHEPGQTHHISQYLGNPDTTLVTGERYVVLGPDFDANDSRYPDLLVAFGVNPAAYEARNGYMVSEQGKPPDFILEVASQHTANADREEKKDYYERLKVGEYWLFDSEGRFYGFVLRGYRLVGGRYEEIEITEIAPSVFEGYSAALNLILRVDDGRLGWHDPATGEHIPTFHSERARADAAESRTEEQTARAYTAEARAEEQTARADAAEAQVRELQAELRRLREGQ